MTNTDHFSALKKRLGKTIRALRHERQFSQEELAHRAGLHRTYVADVERGGRNISLESIAKLASALGKTIEDLFKYSPPNEYAKFEASQQLVSVSTRETA